jgi:DNA polymerase II large subunit
LGDILISYGDFLENNAQLLPASYVEEIWALELFEKIKEVKELDNIEYYRLVNFYTNPFETIPTIKEALRISIRYKIPLHPKYSFYWESITINEFLFLRNTLLSIIDNNYNKPIIELVYNNELKIIFEKLGVSHQINNSDQTILLLDYSQTVSLIFLCVPEAQKLFLLKDDDLKDIYISELFIFLNKDNNILNYQNMINSIIENNFDKNSVIELINLISDIKIRPKFSSSISVRVGRPEKAAERKMKPPIHVLFPVGNKGGPMRDILKAASNSISFYSEKSNRFCNKCNIPSLGTNCLYCGTLTPIKIICKVCKEESLDLSFDTPNSDIKKKKCLRCGNEYKTFSPIQFPLNFILEKAETKLGCKITSPLKGVKSLMGKDKEAEPIEKGVLRQKYGLSVFKDGTIRFDATNEPLTHFIPLFIDTPIAKLHQLGYIKDHQNNKLNSREQVIELFNQDVIIPLESAKHLLKIAKFIDEELVTIYNLSPIYNAYSVDDLVGHLIVGLAPHTSVGIIGRIIGFTDSQVCLGSPIWHSAKRRDCDGDADSIMLLADAFLNFSYSFLPDKIGGLMDAPLLIQPIVLPHEVQRQAHNVDIDKQYPLEFYRYTWQGVKASDISNLIEILKNRIGEDKQFYDYGYTHHSNVLISNINRSAYSTLNTMKEKLQMQISTANLINSVDTDEVMSMVLTTHIIPDIMGNMRSYSSQSFRCNRCGEKYRRIPLLGKCVGCENTLLQTVTRGSVEKYIVLAEDLCNNFKVTGYLKSRIESLIVELNYIFKSKEIQPTLLDFFD